ncbi:unnamed protein product [Anisakis simplex]|uniref:uridine/cytidine kinase n=1 Tax=Anisakis simplex TaxID=6269 RepID=A0A0M3JT29_ANISI|nr:unnamed protein product [Anisakis simplex]
MQPTRLPFIIGVAGGTASGKIKLKSSVCARIIERLGKEHKRRVVAISQDSFYRDLTEEEGLRAKRGDFNFDHPDAFEHTLMLSLLNKLRKGEAVKVPKYDFVQNTRVKDEYTLIEPADVILVEGILIFYEKSLRKLFDMKLFVDADSDDRLARRLMRDTCERGRSLKQAGLFSFVLHQYLHSVKPAFEEFCLPTKKYADVVIPRGVDNEVAIDLILHHIHEILRSPHSSVDGLDDHLSTTDQDSCSLSGGVGDNERCSSSISTRPH